MEMVKSSVIAWAGDAMAENRGFLGSENTLYNMIMIDRNAITHLAKPGEWMTPRANPKVKKL